jgi:hypothetical protein
MKYCCLTTPMLGLIASAVLVAGSAQAQKAPRLPQTRADSLLAEGRWAEAESVFYQQSAAAPRDPVARAALGRFIAMKGGVKPGMVLISEARKFGLDRRIAVELAAPWSAILTWRAEAAELKQDSVLEARSPKYAHGLFQVALPRTDAEGRPANSGSVNEVTWYEVVDREVGLDSLNTPARPIGIEVFEALSPSVDVREGEVTLHANPRSALSATGRRYQVLRNAREVLVLIDDRRVVTLPAALRELKPKWWQLDLPHGILVVR